MDMKRITHRGNLFLYIIEPMTGSLQDQPFPQGTSTETNYCIIDSLYVSTVRYKIIFKYIKTQKIPELTSCEEAVY